MRSESDRIYPVLRDRLLRHPDSGRDTMGGTQPPDATEREPEKKLEEPRSMEEIWAEAAKDFERICGEQLKRGDVRSFEDVQKKIVSGSKASREKDEANGAKWETMKSLGLESLRFLKVLVGTAAQAASFLPLPAGAANIASSALCFVFDIPAAIKNYTDAVNQVFSEVSSALSQFKIYESMDPNHLDPLLIKQIHLVMVSFVKLCAHVVKYRQSRRRDRGLEKVKSVFNHDTDLSQEMAKFKAALQQQRDVEGTITLAVVVETRQDIAELLERFIVFGEATEETQKGVQSLKADADRIKALINIRDTLGVPSTVRLDSRTTQTCSNILKDSVDGTGSWLWNHEAYNTWTAPKDKDDSHALLVSGPPSSGKTTASALIVKRLEDQKGRTYVAHYFFAASTKKSDAEKNPVQSAIKYMAFQIARVDDTAQKALSKVCDTPGAFRNTRSLDNLWSDLKIGTPGTGATYYLVFDGLENLPAAQAGMLISFTFGPQLARGPAGRVRFLASATDETLESLPLGEHALRIRMEEHNTPDMRIIIDETLNKQNLLQNTRSGSSQEKAREKIIERLPQNVKGSYSLLQFGLSEVKDLLSRRTSLKDLDDILDRSMNSHEAAIKELERSLTVDEISELNELLKWVLFSKVTLTLDELESAMYLYSGTESLASLEQIIRNKYSAVLKVEDDCVYDRDGVKDYIEKKSDRFTRSSRAEDRATISMSITVNNVDQELCGHFLWDLAHKGIRDRFKFDLDAAHNTFHNSKATIAVNEFEAHHTIVTRAFVFLNREPAEQTKEIGKYIVNWLPGHLSHLRRLEDEMKGELMPSQQLEIGQNLYELFKDGEVVKRHQESFELSVWTVDEMEDMQKWLMDSAVVRRLDRVWRDDVQGAPSPVRGYLKGVVKVIVEGFVRERSWSPHESYGWIVQFMRADEKKLQPLTSPGAPADSESLSSRSPSEASETEWDHISAWCQHFLGLPDSELDSLWYERLAWSAWKLDMQYPGNGTRMQVTHVVETLYLRALEKANPGWMCYLGLGVVYTSQSRITSAIEQFNLALKETERQDAEPKPESKDIVNLYLVLGESNYSADNAQEAADNYLAASTFKGVGQKRMMQALFGLLKSRLALPNVADIKDMLNGMLAPADMSSTEVSKEGKEVMVGVFKELAWNDDHTLIVAKLFVLVEDDPGLFRKVVRAMELVTEILTSDKARATGLLEDEHFAEDEACGVLLYDRATAAHLYKVSPEGTKPERETERLWKECRDILADVGGRNAYVTRSGATRALSAHYFHSALDGEPGYLDALRKLADADLWHGFAVDYLGAFHALRGEAEQSRAALAPCVKYGLQILSDDLPDNDKAGFIALHEALKAHGDLRNAAVAMSLAGQPDILTEALSLAAEDGTVECDDDMDPRQVLDAFATMASETIRMARAQFPRPLDMIQRIGAAWWHLFLLSTSTTTTTTRRPPRPPPPLPPHPLPPHPLPPHPLPPRPPSAGEEEEEALPLSLSSRIAAAAHRHLERILSDLLSTHPGESGIDPDAVAGATWACDGRAVDGTPCGQAYWTTEHMHRCLYCHDTDLCGDCLARLRASGDSGESDGRGTGRRGRAVGFTACSPRHRWLRLPPMGSDTYAGPRAKSVALPTAVRPVAAAEGEGEVDDGILEVCYDAAGARETTTVDAWKRALAREWNMSPEELERGTNDESYRSDGKRDLRDEEEERE
ncbi:hypothetical protein GGR56DRAFT_634769 [Xylariaceae sp. FL0804]|nr:hypothetical protein GGR56DRAFT_634769 [Xylariaceae sp. FL0804]